MRDVCVVFIISSEQTQRNRVCCFYLLFCSIRTQLSGRMSLDSEWHLSRTKHLDRVENKVRSESISSTQESHRIKTCLITLMNSVDTDRHGQACKQR